MRRVWFLLSFSIVLCWPASARAQAPANPAGELHFASTANQKRSILSSSKTANPKPFATLLAAF